MSPDSEHKVLSPQQTFDVVAIHLLKQGEKSVLRWNPEARTMVKCAYRGDEGRKCAAGVLIPDSLYNAEWNTVSIGALPPEVRAALGWDNTELFRLVCQLQSVHDDGRPDNWPVRLRVVARSNNLHMMVLDSFEALS